MARGAAAALAKLVVNDVQVVYAVEGFADPEQAHRWLKENGLPEGPIVTWQDKRPVTGTLVTLRSTLTGQMVAAGQGDGFLEAAKSMNLPVMYVGTRHYMQFQCYSDWNSLADTLLKAEK